MAEHPHSPKAGSRTLVLMRHAKSSWVDLGMDDHSRPLNERGRNAAPLMALWLAQQNLIPNLILCSTAIRTQQTSDLLQGQWQAIRKSGEPKIDVPQMNCAELYLATPNAILECLANRCVSEPMPRKVLVLAHNPGLELLASMLSGQIVTMPTAACVVFDVDPQQQTSWKIDLHTGGIFKSKQVAPKGL